MPDLSSWMPADLEQRLLDPTDGPAMREAWNIAKRSHDLGELHPWEAWRFVIECVDRLNGPPPDPCCCCSRSTTEGAQKMAAKDVAWRRAVKATVKHYPGWVPA